MRQVISRCLAAGAALAAGIAPAGAADQLQNYYRAGAWNAFSGRTDTGAAVCGVSTATADGGRDLSIQYDIGGSDTMFSASKPDWSIPAGTHASVVMQVGLDTPWTMQGVAESDGHGISWTLDPDAIRTFDAQFRVARSMTVTFPDGNEPPWTVSLAGSTMISDTLGRCVRDLTQQVRSSQQQPMQGTQTSQGPTQPFTPPASPPQQTDAPPQQAADSPQQAH